MTIVQITVTSSTEPNAQITVSAAATAGDETSTIDQLLTDAATRIRRTYDIDEPTTPAPAPGPTYQVGDPDPTPGTGIWCRAGDGTGLICTWRPGHTGPHVAGNGSSIITVWDEPTPDTPPTPEHPDWLLDLIAAVEGHEDDHAPVHPWPCLRHKLAAVPTDIRDTALTRREGHGATIEDLAGFGVSIRDALARQEARP